MKGKNRNPGKLKKKRFSFHSVTKCVTIVILMVTFTQTSEGTALFGKTRRAVLSLLFTHPGESFYLRQIVRLTGMGLGPVQRELKTLTDAGIINREKSGNQVYFSANEKSPIYSELKTIIVKTSGVADVISKSLAPLAEKIKLAFIYGSFAKSGEDRRSDIDILIVGDASLREVVSALHKAHDILMREINPVTFSEKEFKQRLIKKEHFITSVWKGKKILIAGEINEFKGLGGK